jgi:predicted  nucleic acid-binding Zn-ribbon protein
MQNYYYASLKNIYNTSLQCKIKKNEALIESYEQELSEYKKEYSWALTKCPNICIRLKEYIDDLTNKIERCKKQESIDEFKKKCEPYLQLIQEQRITPWEVKKYHDVLGMLYRPNNLMNNGGGNSSNNNNNNNTNEQLNSNINLHICARCNEARYYDEYEAFSICPKCGHSVAFQRDSNEAEETMQYTIQFEYDRENHLREYLNQIIKAVENAKTLPKSLIRGIKRQILKERITNRTMITPKRIKEWLKRDLKMSKYSEKVYSILYVVCKIMPPQIPKALEEKYYEMFAQIQVPFAKHVPAGRVHFFNYGYLLRKFNELLDQTHLLPVFPILKGADRVHFQDVIFEKCCKDLGWKFIPSI